MQPAFLSALLKACRAQEIHTVVDTSGFANWKVFEQIREDVDLFLYDLKHMDSIRHREVTGVPNDVILENLRRLNAAGSKCIVRIPLIPGINDDEKNLFESGKFLASLPHIQSVEVMGYHDIAQAKYEALGREYALIGTKPPTESAMHHAAEVLRSYGLTVMHSIIVPNNEFTVHHPSSFIIWRRPCQLQNVSKCCASNPGCKRNALQRAGGAADRILPAGNRLDCLSRCAAPKPLLTSWSISTLRSIPAN